MMRKTQIIYTETIDNREAKRQRTVLLGGLTFVVCIVATLQVASQVLWVNFGGRFHLLCPFLAVTDIPCPFCGLTGSLLSLLQGDLPKAFWHHPFGPALWGGAVVIGISSLGLSFVHRKISLRVSRRAAMISIAVVALIAWSSIVLFGHH